MFHRPKTDQADAATQAGNNTPSPAAQPQQSQSQQPQPQPSQPQPSQPQPLQPQQAQPQSSQPQPSPVPQPQPAAAASSVSETPSASSSWTSGSPFTAAARPAAAAEPAQEKDAARSSSPFSKDNTETKTQHNKPEEKKMNIKEDHQDGRPSIPAQPTYQPAPAATQPPRAPGASYAYPGASAPVPGNAYGAPEKKTASGRRLVIGEGITMSGEIEACDYLVVEGTVEAALKGASVLEISEGGTFYGTVEIDEATIAGRFEGDIVVSGRLTVTATGSITGSIAYKELAVEGGAVLDGKINPLGGSKVAAVKKNERPLIKTPKAGRNDNSDEGSQLPFAAAGNAAAAAE